MAEEVSIGDLVPDGEPNFTQQDWMQFVQAHPQLRVPSPKEGIDPFTRQPMMFRAHPDTGVVSINGSDVGMIHWSLDESLRILVVWAEQGAEAQVTQFAREIAASIGWKFIPGSAIQEKSS